MSPPDWSTLQPDLLESISRSLTSNADYVRFRAVCSLWRSATAFPPFHRLPLQLPWLLFPPQPTSFFLTLHDPTNPRSLPLPDSSTTHFLGSSPAGWLVARGSGRPSPISLFNPVTKARIPLPPLKTFPLVHPGATGGRPFFVKKVALSPPPITAVAVLGRSPQLALSRPGIGDGSWTLLSGDSSYNDALFHRGKLYVVDGFGRVFVVEEDDGGEPRLAEVVRVELPQRVPPFLRRGQNWYLAELDGDNGLLLAVRHFSSKLVGDRLNSVVTENFRVFALDLEGSRWTELNSLGNRMLFLGLNQSLLLSADGEHRSRGCRGNCIYFVDDLLNSLGDVGHRNYDAGVFNMADSSIEPLPCFVVDGGSRNCLRPPPVWLAPSLC